MQLTNQQRRLIKQYFWESHMFVLQYFKHADLDAADNDDVIKILRARCIDLNGTVAAELDVRTPVNASQTKACSKD